MANRPKIYMYAAPSTTVQGRPVDKKPRIFWSLSQEGAQLAGEKSPGSGGSGGMEKKDNRGGVGVA